MMPQKKPKTRQLDWADGVAIRLMNRSSSSGRRYYKDLKTELRLKVWGPKEKVPVWME